MTKLAHYEYESPATLCVPVTNSSSSKFSLYSTMAYVPESFVPRDLGAETLGNLFGRPDVCQRFRTLRS